MTRYYIYSVKNANEDESQIIVVNDVQGFVKEAYDPSCMNFSGVSIEAKTVKEAAEAFSNPNTNTPIFNCEEPRETAQLRTLKGVNKDLNLLAAKILAIKSADVMTDLEESIWEMANFIHDAEGKKEHLLYVYQRITQGYIDLMRDLRDARISRINSKDNGKK